MLLATKTHIPPVRGNLVNRPQLVQRLNDGLAQRQRLTLISAPAGYGKSTLLSEWVSQLDIPAAWLSLEEGENVPTRFWTYFVTALSTIPGLQQAGIGEAIRQDLQSPQPPAMEGLLANLVNDFSRLQSNAVLVLDDLHTIKDSQIHEDLLYLIGHLPLSPSRLHLVVASRRDPPWPLARWRARNELNELRPADLRFSYQETGRFLSQSLQHSFSSQDVVALQDRTEGWIAGLQMAAVSMKGWLQTRGSPGVSHFIETFTGSHRYILDYLMEEVINQQPAGMRDFLHETAILEHLTAPLCEAVTGRIDSQTILNQVEQLNLFLLPLDDERQWFRYHRLFADLLYKRLKQNRPDHLVELHRRASRWYADNDFLSQAIAHALEAEDLPGLNELVSGNALAVLENSELLGVLSQFEKIPDRQIAAKPWLGVSYAWVKAFANPSGDVERILQHSGQGLAGVEDETERLSLQSHLDAIRAYVFWVKGEADQALAFARSAMENLPEGDRTTRAHLFNIEGLAFIYLYNLPAAIQSFEAALAAGQSTNHSFDTMVAANLVSVYFLQGRLRQTFSRCQQVLSLAKEPERGSKPLLFLAHLYGTISRIQLEWNYLESALYYARECVSLAEQWNQADTLQSALTCLSQALCTSGNLEEAMAVNQRAMQLAVKVSPWYFRFSACNEVLLNLAKGDIPAAAQRFAEIEPLIGERDKRGRFLVTRASLLYAQGRFTDLILALEEPVGELERTGQVWYLLNLMTFQALAMQALGREDEAISVIAGCLALAAPEGYVRLFVDRGAPMFQLLQAALSRGIQTDYLNQLLPAFEMTAESPDSPRPVSSKIRSPYPSASLIEPLSRRELEVLRFLNTHLSTPEIAQELVVAPSTIRTHVRNIYNKLEVHSRIEALHKARGLGLI